MFITYVLFGRSRWKDQLRIGTCLYISMSLGTYGGLLCISHGSPDATHKHVFMSVWLKWHIFWSEKVSLHKFNKVFGKFFWGFCYLDAFVFMTWFHCIFFELVKILTLRLLAPIFISCCLLMAELFGTSYGKLYFRLLYVCVTHWFPLGKCVANFAIAIASWT